MKTFIKRNMLGVIVGIAALLSFFAYLAAPPPPLFNSDISDNASQTQAQTQFVVKNTNTSQISSSLGSLRPNHVAISVPNLEEAVRWYQEKLNFRVTKITRIPEISAQRAWLDLNGFVMEIFVRPKSARLQPPPRVIEDGMLAQGYFHIAFTVGDLDAVAAELHQRGVRFFFEPKTFNSDKRKVCFIKDNNGNPIELVQLLDQQPSN